MAAYRTTVILKTDIVDSTPRLAEQTQAEMGLQRKQHRQFISESAATHFGSIFQEEGDAYLIEFPSVTDATLAAIDMHQNLRATQTGKGEKQRLAIRAVITVGDILHQENDAMGMTMSLLARIEKITPPDEIYLSHAAWLVLNKAEVQTSFVGEFPMKGFSEPEKIYRVSQEHRVRSLTNQCIIFVDAKGFSAFYKSTTMNQVEEFLLEYDRLMSRVCDQHGGIIRSVNGDMYFLTFSTVDQTISAIRTLCQEWKEVLALYDVGISMGVHKGDLHAFRSYVFGEDINIAMYLSDLTTKYKTDKDKIIAVVSENIKTEAEGTGSDLFFQELDDRGAPQGIHQAHFHIPRSYRLIIN